MAEKKPAGSDKKSIRRVKNPETFRERAIKAAAVQERPARHRRVGSGLRKVLSAIFSPIWRGLRALFRIQPFKFIGKVVVFIVRLIGRVLVPRFVRNSWRELRQVKWPSWRESRQLTFAVLLFAVAFGAYVAVLDWGLDKAFKHLLLK